MRLTLQLLGFKLCITLGIDNSDDDEDDGDPGPGASVALDQQGPFGFTRYHYSESPDEW